MQDPISSYWRLLAALAVIKLGFLVALGPVFLPDSSDYVQFADAILGDRHWLTALDLHAELIPLTTVRAIGYPALIALAKAVFGGAWAWIIVLVQIAVSLTATWMVMRLTWALTGRTWAALFVGLAQGTALGFTLDQCVLTDSLNSALLILAGTKIGLYLLADRPPTPARAAGVGGVLLAAFMLREAGWEMQVAFWPLIGLWCLSGRLSIGRSAVVLIAFVLPLCAGVQAYEAWNQFRTGQRFITTVGQTAMYHPVVDLARRGVPVFAEDPLLADDPVLRKPMPAIPGRAFAEINRHLATVHGLDAVAIARHAGDLFRLHWRRYPVERARIYLSKFNLSYTRLLFMPLRGPERLSIWAGGPTPFPRPGKIWDNLVHHYRVDQIALLAVRTLARAVSAGLTLVFLFGVPILTVRRLAAVHWRPQDLAPRDLLLPGLWLMALAYPLAYALVYLEDRYLLPALPFALIAATAVAAPWCEHVAARIAGRRPVTGA